MNKDYYNWRHYFSSLQYFHLPGATEIVGALDEQRGRPESFEGHDQVSKVEFGFQVQLDADVLDAVLRLPPGASAGPNGTGWTTFVIKTSQYYIYNDGR